MGVLERINAKISKLARSLCSLGWLLVSRLYFRAVGLQKATCIEFADIIGNKDKAPLLRHFILIGFIILHIYLLRLLLLLLLHFAFVSPHLKKKKFSFMFYCSLPSIVIILQAYVKRNAIQWKLDTKKSDITNYLITNCFLRSQWIGLFCVILFIDYIHL